jgi:UDP-N-acetylmuramate: L-alanyl-gamma-D-glutamyl-meso-diaminopimelate ligase
MSIQKDTRLHFIGIAGKGMSAVALMLAEYGCRITGSDQGAYEPVSGTLKRAGISFATHYAPGNIPEDTDIIVIGKHAELIPEKNSEVAYAFASGKKILSFPQIIEILTETMHRIVIAGSYGKSTCTALITHLLKYHGHDPSFLIGAISSNFTHSGYLGKDPLCVLEGDEYPSSNWDATSKFMYYHPHTLLLTSCEHDHINVFPTLESYLEPYEQLVTEMRTDALIICAIHHPHVQHVIANSSARIVTYGLENADWTAKNISYSNTTVFDLYHHDTLMGTYTTHLLGQHTIENCVGALALCFEKNLITVETAQKAIPAFRGLEGRIDQKETMGSIRVYEGFGSSYTKAKNVFDTLRLHFPQQRQICIFEPHTFSWRNRNYLDWYHDVFIGVEYVIILNPPHHGATSHDQVTGQEILEQVTRAGITASLAEHPDDVFELLKKNLMPHDIVSMVTSGDLQGLREKIPEFISNLNH